MAYLEDLESIVRTQIRDNGAVQAFQNSELDLFIMDAIAQYSRYLPRKRPFTLNIVAGQSTYTLPPDWITRDYLSFDRAKNPQPKPGIYGLYAYEFDVMMTVPANLGLRDITFDFYDDDQIVVLTPAPMQSYTLTFDYFAMHQVTSSAASPSQPCTIPQQDQYVAMYWASAQALDALVTDKSNRLQKYKIGNSINVDSSDMLASLEKRAEQFRQEWRNEIMLRPKAQRAGDLSRYNVADYGWWY